MLRLIKETALMIHRAESAASTVPMDRILILAVQKGTKKALVTEVSCFHNSYNVTVYTRAIPKVRSPMFKNIK
jgi:hypothetical protein